ncbi:hypothetical protein UM764_09875 [Staphylococcus aureus]|nr:hypothetical protein UM764_09875 [Staphylococcus aureus]WRN72560.1 hypothetical protein UM582_12580 [Staphylococcus aureus]
MNQDTLVQVNQLEPLDDLLDILEQSSVEEPPISVKDGGLFKVGFNMQLDEYLEASKNGKTWLAELQAKERQRTGIKSLKISFNKSVWLFYRNNTCQLAKFLNQVNLVI